MVFCLSISAANEGGSPRKQDPLPSGQKKIQTNVRVLRGHSGAITALHCVTRREVWDLVGDREDAGFFISGSTDCLVSLPIWVLLLTFFLSLRGLCYAVLSDVIYIIYLRSCRLRSGILVSVVLNFGQL